MFAGFRQREPLFGNRIHLAPAPRPVSGAAMVQVLFGGMRQIGWIFMAISSLLLWLFALDSEMMTPLDLGSDLASTEGVVTGVRPSSATENKRRVMAVDFTYTADGREHRATSYSVRSIPAIGSKVPVEYAKKAPAKARIAGLRFHKFGVSGGFVVLPFAITIVFLIVFFVRGLREIRLLRGGQLAFARLVTKEPTGGRVNKKPVYRYTFELDVEPPQQGSYRAAPPAMGKHRFVVKTHLGRVLEDEPLEPALYFPNKPGSGLALDAVAVTPDATGGFAAKSSSWLFLVLPIATVALNLVAFVIR